MRTMAILAAIFYFAFTSPLLITYALNFLRMLNEFEFRLTGMQIFGSQNRNQYLYNY